jgi:uncharacterized membrane protein HdeD (DUF308 family)
MIIALGGDFETFKIGGSGWIVFGGFLLLILSILVLVNPFGAGVATVIVFTGVGLILFGGLLCGESLLLRRVHEAFES